MSRFVYGLFICLIFNLSCSHLEDSITNHTNTTEFVKVTKVIDGDTFWVDDGKETFKVRFIGIDAPEIRNSRYKKKGYYGVEAKDYVTALTQDQWVHLEYDVQKTDRYGRQLAYVYLEDGTFLNADLVANGYAVVDTYPPNVKYVDVFIELQGEARENQVGVWAVYGLP